MYFVSDVIHSISSLVLALCPIAESTRAETCSWIFMNYNGTHVKAHVTLPLLSMMSKYYQRTLHILLIAIKVLHFFAIW